MSSLLASLSSDPTLASYIAGAGDQAVSAVSSFVAPDVPVPTLLGHYKKWKAKDKLVIPDTRRSLGSDGTFIDLSLEGDTYNCTPHALNVGVDFLETDEAKVVTNLIQSKARTAASLGGMAHEKRVLDAMMNGATDGDGIDTTSGSTDVIKILNNHLLDVIKGAKGWGGAMELRLLIGATALAKITSHTSVLSRYKMPNKSGGFVSPTVDDIASMLMLGVKAQVSLMIYDKNANKDDEDVDFLLGSNILVFASVPNPTDYDTSFMKTFRKMGESMTARYWAAPSGRQNFAGFDWSEDIQVSNSDASRLCDVT